MAAPWSKDLQAPMMIPPVPSAASVLGAQTPQASPTPPIQVLHVAVETARNELDKEVVHVRDMIQLIQKTAGVSRSMFGEKAVLTQHLIASMKAAAKMAQSKQDCREAFEQHFKHAEQLLKQLSGLAQVGQTGTRSYPSATPLTKKLFIVHGHDTTNWLLMRHILMEPPYLGHGIEPIVIREQAGQSKSILQKFEDAAAESSYAICIFTPDDFVQVRKDGSRFEQARPNVIFETGWFVGRLGPSRVLLLVKDGTQLHSDFDGISKIPFSESVEEQMVQISRELVAAGLMR